MCQPLRAHSKDKRVYAMTKQENDSVWSGSEDGMLCHWNLSRKLLATSMFENEPKMIKYLQWIDDFIWILRTDATRSILSIQDSSMKINTDLELKQPCHCFLQVNNSIWIGGNSSIFVVDKMLKKVIHILLTEAKYIKAMVLVEDHVWCATRNGLLVWNVEKRELVHWLNQTEQITSLCRLSTYAIFTGSSEGFISVWNTKKFIKERTQSIHQDKIECMIFMGSFLWTGSLDKTLCVCGRTK